MARYQNLQSNNSGAFILGSGAYTDATQATGVGGYLHTSGVTGNWSDVKFFSVLAYSGADLPSGNPWGHAREAQSSGYNFLMATGNVLGGTGTPIGHIRGENTYVNMGAETPATPNAGDVMTGAFYAAYGNPIQGYTYTGKLCIGSSAPFDGALFYEGEVQLGNIHRFETEFEPNTGNLSATGAGSGIYLDESVVTIEASITDQLGNLITDRASLEASPFVDYIEIDLLNADGTMAAKDWKTNWRSPRVSIERIDKVNIWGQKPPLDYITRFNVYGREGRIQTTDMHLFANQVVPVSVTTLQSGQTTKTETSGNVPAFQTGSIGTYEDALDAVRFTTNQQLNVSGASGEVVCIFDFEDDEYTQIKSVGAWASTGGPPIINQENFLGNLPLAQAGAGQRVVLDKAMGLPEAKDFWVKFAFEGGAGLADQIWDDGPFMIDPVSGGMNPTLTDLGDQRIRSGNFIVDGNGAGYITANCLTIGPPGYDHPYTIYTRSGYVGIGTNAIPLFGTAKLSVNGDTVGTGDGNRLTGPNGLPYLLSGDAAGGSQNLQEVTTEGNTTNQGIEVTAGGIKVNDYITHYGDTDTYAGFPSNDNFTVFTAGSSALNIDSSQQVYFPRRVGIGSTPDSTQEFLVVGNSVEVEMATSDGYSIRSAQKADISIGGTISSSGSMIAGGSGNHISGDFDTIAGGTLNNISGGNFNFIGGGSQIDLTGSQYSSSVGGKNNDIISSNYALIGGGQNNKIENSTVAFIGGGSSNQIHDGVSAIGGGVSNRISGGNGYSFIGGGEENEVRGTFSSVLGGEGNKVYGSDAVTLGGWFTESTGRFALVGPGKASKVSGDYAVGLGNKVEIPIAHTGATVLADGQDRVHASSGMHTATLDFASGVYVPTIGYFGQGLHVSGVPVLTGENNPAEADTLQTVTTRGNTTSTSILSTGPHISGVTGLFQNGIGINTTDVSSSLTVSATGDSHAGGYGNNIKLNGSNYPSILFDASSNNDFLLGVDGNGFNIKEAGSDTRLVIDNNGNVGIGTHDPDQTLHVKGIGMIEDTSSTAYGTLQFGTDTSRYIRGNSAELQAGSTIQQLHFQKTNAAAQIASSAADGTDAIQLLARTVHTSANIMEVVNGNAAAPIFTIDYTGNVEVTGNILGTGLGQRITAADGKPYLISGDVAAEADTLQTVTTRGNTTSTSILSTGPHISGGTGLFSEKVGIGTNTPSKELTVSGDIQLDGDNQQIFFGGANTYVGELSNSQKLQLRGGGSNSTHTAVLDSAGRLGLATTVPQVRLHLDNSDGTDEFLRFSDSAAADVASVRAYQQYYMGNNTTRVGYFGFTTNETFDMATTSSNGALRFIAGNNAVAMKIKSDGKVGIGTETPLTLLDVRGDISGSGSFLGTGVGNRITNNHIPYLLSGDEAGATNTLQDVTDNGNTTTNAIIIENTGQDGFDFAPLTVSGAHNGTQAVFRGTGIHSFIQFQNSTTAYGSYSQNGLTIGNNGADAYITQREAARLYLMTSGEVKMTIMGDNAHSKVGIGTATPDSPAGSDSFLDIYGATDAGLVISSNNGTWDLKNTNPNADLVFYRDGSTRVTFAQAGNVGIGSAVPARKLDVVGDAAVSTNLVVGTALYSNQWIANSSATQYIKNSSAATSVAITNSGYVGIKNNNPEYALDVSGDVAGTGNGSRITLNGTPYLLSGDVAGEADTLQTVTTRGNTTSTSILSTGPHISGVTGLYSDKVGIGTTNPSYPLHVRKSVNGNFAARLTNTESTAGANYGVMVDGGTNSSDTSFEVRNSNLGDTYFKIRGDGNVGIGSASPDAHLNVYNTGTTSSVADVHFVGSGNTYGLLVERLRNDSLIVSKSPAGAYIKTDSAATSYQGYEIGTNWFIGQYAYGSTSQDLRIVDGTKNAGTAAITIQDSTQNVGIGTTAPSESLEVSGNVLLGPAGGGAGDETPFLKIDGYDEHGIEMGWGTWTKWKITTKVNGQLEIYNTGVQHQSQQVSIGREGYHEQGNLMVYSTGSVLRAGHNTTSFAILDIGVQDANSSYQGDAYIDLRENTSTKSRFHFKRDGEFIASGVSVSGDVLGTGVGNRITNDGTPYLLSGDSPAETQTLQNVCDNGSTTTTSVTIGDDLAVDTDTLFVDASTDRVGINRNSLTTYDLEVRNGAGGSSSLGIIGGSASSLVLNTTDTSIVTVPAAQMFLRATGGFYFQSGTTTKAVLTKEGDFGIGTDSPSARLHVAGGNILVDSQYGIRFNDYNTRIYTNSETPEDLLIEADQDLHLDPDGVVKVDTAEFQITSSAAYTTHLNYNNAGSNFISQANGGATQFRNSAGTLMQLNSNGNLSVGAASDTTTRFFVTGAVSDSLAKFQDDVDGVEITTRGSSRQQIDFLGSNTSAINAKGSLFINYDSDNGGSNDTITFTRNGVDEAGTVDMVITEGKVGIANSNPQFELDVSGDVAGTGDGSRITLNGTPYLLSGDSPAETQTLQDVCDNGNTTTTAVNITGALTLANHIFKNVENSFLGLYGGTDTLTNDGFIKIYGDSSNWGKVQTNIGYDATNSKAHWTLNNTTELMTLKGDGSLGVGTTSISNKLDVAGSVGIGSSYAGTAAPSNGAIIEGNVGIGTSSVSNNLDVAGAIAIGASFAGSSAPSNGAIIEGNVGIGTSYASNALDVNGHLSATSKSFLIDHPIEENKKLQYACLEGPENGVYVRGTTNSASIELPDYWSELIHEDSITVVVTPIGKKQDLYIKSKSPQLIMIGGVKGSYDYVVYGERKDIDKLEIEPLKV